MEITRNVIQDLLPLFLAGEASDDTMVLVREYLEIDRELAEIAHQARLKGLDEVPVPLSKEDEMESLKKANTTIWVRTIALAFLFLVVAGCTLTFMALMFLTRG